MRARPCLVALVALAACNSPAVVEQPDLVLVAGADLRVAPVADLTASAGVDLAGLPDLALTGVADLGVITAADLSMTAGADLTTVGSDLAFSAYPSGPYGGAVGDVLANLSMQGYWSPTKITGLATTEPYGTITFDQMRRSGARYALLHLVGYS